VTHLEANTSCTPFQLVVALASQPAMQQCVLASGLLEAMAAAALRLADGGPLIDGDPADGYMIDYAVMELSILVRCLHRSGMTDQLAESPAFTGPLLQLVPHLADHAIEGGTGDVECILWALHIVQELGLLEAQPARLRELQLQRVLHIQDDPLAAGVFAKYFHTPVLQLLQQAADSWAQPGPGEVQALMQVLSPYLEVRVLGGGRQRSSAQPLLRRVLAHMPGSWQRRRHCT
jgi:hypothetical protein